MPEDEPRPTGGAEAGDPAVEAESGHPPYSVAPRRPTGVASTATANGRRSGAAAGPGAGTPGAAGAVRAAGAAGPRAPAGAVPAAGAAASTRPITMHAISNI